MEESHRFQESPEVGISWDLLEKSREIKDFHAKELNEELKGLVESGAVIKPDRENAIFESLAKLLPDPEVDTDLILQSLGLLSKLGCKVGDKFYKYVLEGKSGHARSLDVLVAHLPYLPAHFSSSLIESLVPQLVNDINKDNIIEKLAVLRGFLLSMPQIGKTYGISFLGEYFNSGKKLGEGKFGLVNLGYHTRTAVPVAIKTINWKNLTQGKTEREAQKCKKRLTNEVLVMRQTTHENTVKLYDIVQEGRSIHLIIEYVAGGSFADYLKDKVILPEEEVKHWLKQLVAGLKFMRKRNIVHRDLKPDNLLLTAADPEGILKISDFGLSRFLGTDSLADTHVGTPLYMAPEIFQPVPYTDKADIWSVGVIVFEMLTGDLPYLGDNIMQLLQNIRAKDVEFPRNIDVSEELKELVVRMLKKSVVERINWEDLFNHSYIKGIPIRKSLEVPIPQNAKEKLQRKKREVKDLRLLVQRLKEDKENVEEEMSTLQEELDNTKAEFEKAKAEWAKEMEEQKENIAQTTKRLYEMEEFVERAKDEVKALKKTFANEDLKIQFEALRKEQEEFEKDKQLAKKIHQEEIKEAWKALNEEKQRMEGVMQFQEQQIKLDVGGMIYATSLAVLTKYPDSLLQSMFSGRYSMRRNEQGAFFIDRDGTLFRYILNYLRDEELILPQSDESTLRQLLKEAKFYRLTRMVKLIKKKLKGEDLEEESEGQPLSQSAMPYSFDPENKHKSMTLSNNNLTATNSNWYTRWATNLVTPFVSMGKKFFLFRIDYHSSEFCRLRIGVFLEEPSPKGKYRETPTIACDSDGTLLNQQKNKLMASKVIVHDVNKEKRKMNTGSVIGLLVDMSAHKVDFLLDKKKIYTVFFPKETLRVYPAVSCFWKNQITLLPPDSPIGSDCESGWLLVSRDEAT